MLLKYVRDKNRQPIGVVLALGKDKIGWSKCNFSKGDRFDKERGKMIALKRAEKYAYTSDQYSVRDPKFSNYCVFTNFFDDHNVAQDVRPDFLEMVERAERYYKDNKENSK